MRTCLYLSAMTIVAGLAESGALVPAAHAQGMHAIYTFGTAPDGAQPNGGLVRDSVGRLLGVTAAGGAYGYGTVYRLTRQNNNQWTEEILHSFNDEDGNRPTGLVLIDASGAIFGAAQAGGTNGTGTVYRLDDVNGTWILTTLHAFGQLGGMQDFNFPRAGLTAGPNGLLYGVAVQAGPGGQGGIFAVSPAAMPNGYSIIKAFSGQLGGDGDPINSLLLTDGGHLIGLAHNESEGTFGVAFDLYQLPDGIWKNVIIHNFQGPPTDADVFPSDRILVPLRSGTLVGCGAGGQYSQGVIYTLSVPPLKGAPWTESILYNFGGQINDPSIDTLCGVTVAPDGSILGTTAEGGTYGLGTIFHLTPPQPGSELWQDTVLHNATKGGQDGRYPVDGLLRVGANYYGVATQSNHNGPGVVFVIRP